ncbi:mitochondrial dynamin GTPase Msp1 [Paramarasmius palmivorus]|uniref:Mitochondrial dynamin GTPase Msp1 n=1 Tax=Paramarasmius palmivorus TaxID=297713 RepID=A0AAW0BH80_9AGAR
MPAAAQILHVQLCGVLEYLDVEPINQFLPSILLSGLENSWQYLQVQEGRSLNVSLQTRQNPEVANFDLAVALFVATQAAVYYTIRWVLDSSTGKSREVKTKQLEALKRLGHKLKDLELDEYEATIANEIIHPDDISVTFPDIGGLDPIISSLRESVIYPLLYPSLFSGSSSLLGAPKGVLLYGPPGCGKTMLAKALAKESGATFINIAASVLTNKWFGESNKLIAGLFSLARKTQPSIIFIDEIDSFLRERSSGDHEAMSMMKAEFMTLWDGLKSSNERILVLGATNRPNDIDSAIFRRLPKRFAVSLPDHDQRLKILNLMLKDTSVSPDFQIEFLAQISEGLSGSDLKELCRNAAMIPVREYMRENLSNGQVLDQEQIEAFKPRPLVIQDFLTQEGVSLLAENAVLASHRAEKSILNESHAKEIDAEVVD